MATFDIVMPKMGESIIEATITKWLKNEGDHIELDDPIVEIATDKVDSEIPSPVEGTLVRLNYKPGDVVPVGEVIAVVDTGGEASGKQEKAAPAEKAPEKPVREKAQKTEPVRSGDEVKEPAAEPYVSSRFYSPLVKNIAKQENLTLRELDSIKGTGKDERVTKQDILNFLSSRQGGAKAAPAVSPVISFSGED